MVFFSCDIQSSVTISMFLWNLQPVTTISIRSTFYGLSAYYLSSVVLLLWGVAKPSAVALQNKLSRLQYLIYFLVVFTIGVPQSPSIFLVIQLYVYSHRPWYFTNHPALIFHDIFIISIFTHKKTATRIEPLHWFIVMLKKHWWYWCTFSSKRICYIKR